MSSSIDANYRGDVVSHLREQVSVKNIELVHDIEIGQKIFPRQFHGVATGGRRPFDDLVVDIGEVLDVIYLESAIFEVTPADVGVHEEARMTDVWLVLRRHSAYVHRCHITERLERLLPFAGSVEQANAR